VGIPDLYTITGIMLSEALQRAGQPQVAQQVFETARGVAQATRRTREFGLDRATSPSLVPQESPLSPLIPADTAALQGARPGAAAAPPERGPADALSAARLGACEPPPWCAEQARAGARVSGRLGERRRRWHTSTDRTTGPTIEPAIGPSAGSDARWAPPTRTRASPPRST
jgi:hypothetical protein